MRIAHRRSAVTRVSAIIGIVAAAAALALAQEAQTPTPSTKGMVAKGKAPVNEAVLEVKLPRPQEADLPNGLHLIVLEDHRAPLVTFSLIVRGAGGYYDPEALPGLASFTASLMREGTATRTSQQISEQLERMAANLSINAGMSSVESTVSGSSLSENFADVMAITADVLLNPSFPDKEIVLFKQRTGAQLTQQRSQPGFLASERFARVVYGNHPASRVAPTPEALNAVTRAQLAEFHKAHYAPDRAALAVAGDVSMAEVRQLVETHLGGWKKAGTPAPGIAEPPAAGPARVYLVARPNSVQTNLVVGTQAINRTSPDYDVVQVMNKIIGGGPTGRLFMLLREEKGYTYGAYSVIAASQYRGAWQASTQVRTEVTEPALRDLLGELATMRDRPVPATDLQIAKRSMVASFALSLESPPQMLGYYTTRWLYDLPADYWDKFPERTMAVTAVQVQDASKKYLDPARVQIVAVGDASKIEAALAKFGPLEVYDTEGKRVSQ
ncbi:MAG TPA: pitrilysin family protein [Vicinamibacterales bacterium]|nr:pitrilysin family protein [Vicinamibacterales bacterium]